MAGLTTFEQVALQNPSALAEELQSRANNLANRNSEFALGDVGCNWSFSTKSSQLPVEGSYKRPILRSSEYSFRARRQLISQEPLDPFSDVVSIERFTLAATNVLMSPDNDATAIEPASLEAYGKDYDKTTRRVLVQLNNAAGLSLATCDKEIVLDRHGKESHYGCSCPKPHGDDDLQAADLAPRNELMLPWGDKELIDVGAESILRLWEETSFYPRNYNEDYLTTSFGLAFGVLRAVESALDGLSSHA